MFWVRTNPRPDTIPRANGHIYFFYGILIVIFVSGVIGWANEFQRIACERLSPLFALGWSKCLSSRYYPEVRQEGPDPQEKCSKTLLFVML